MAGGSISGGSFQLEMSGAKSVGSTSKSRKTMEDSGTVASAKSAKSKSAKSKSSKSSSPTVPKSPTKKKEEIDEAAVTFGQSALADPGVAIADMVINNMEEDPTQRKVGSIYKDLNCLCNPTRAKRPGEICSRLGKWCVVNANQIFSSIIGE